MKRKYVSVPLPLASCCLLIVCILMSLPLLASDSSGNLQFEAAKDIGALMVENESENYSPGSHSEIISLHVETEAAMVFKTGQDFDLLQIAGLTSHGEPGEPTIYSKPLELKLNKNVRITGVKLISGKYVELSQAISLAPRPRPLAWSKEIQQDLTLRKNESIYSRDALFPGNTVSYVSGRDLNNTVVFVQLNVSQYNPVKKQLFLLTDAQVEISYVTDNTSLVIDSSSKITTDASNIIITIPEFSATADSLKDLHETLEGVSTEVITTNWISSNYSAADNPTIPGYGTESNTPVNNSYDYDLARKIISYLRDTSAHPNLTSITLLGDADKIPPSYYFHIQVEADPNEFGDWICSDLFYSSPDYDMVLNFELGRLPATDLAEASLMFNKIKHWKTNLNTSWFNNVQLVGGAPFESMFLFGETMTLDPVNKDYFRGLNIGKNFLTRGNQNSAHVLPYFSDENTGLLFHIGHGGGSVIFMGREAVGYQDLMALPTREKFPIIVSIACLCGAYDTELMNNAPFGSRCFAEGVMASQAGGIAYFGGVRYNYGDPQMNFQPDGSLSVSGLSQMGAILNGLFKNWSEGTLKLGTLAKDSCNSYVSNSGLSDPVDKMTLYEFVFLGDPVCSILPQTGTSYDKPAISINPAPSIPGSGTPPMYSSPVYNFDLLALAGGITHFPSASYTEKMIILNRSDISSPLLPISSIWHALKPLTPKSHAFISKSFLRPGLQESMLSLACIPCLRIIPTLSTPQLHFPLIWPEQWSRIPMFRSMMFKAERSGHLLTEQLPRARTELSGMERTTAEGMFQAVRISIN